MKNLFNVKYLVASVSSTVVLTILILLLNRGYFLVDDISATYYIIQNGIVEMLISIFIFQWFVAYMHEQIPHCAQKTLTLTFKFGSMLIPVFLGTFLFFGYIFPIVNTFHLFYVIDLVLILSYVSAFVNIFVLYKFAPGKDVRKTGTCIAR